MIKTYSRDQIQTPIPFFWCAVPERAGHDEDTYDLSVPDRHNAAQKCHFQPFELVVHQLYGLGIVKRIRSDGAVVDVWFAERNTFFPFDSSLAVKHGFLSRLI